MKNRVLFTGAFVALFLGCAMTAQAGTHFSFGFSVGVGPYYPCSGCAYRVYAPDYVGYYGYPSGYYYYPAYRTYVVPRYYSPRYNESRHYRRDNGNRWIREGRSNYRSRSGRWR